MNKMEIWFCIVLILRSTLAQQSCDYALRINPGEKYSLANDNYPNYYTPGKSCSYSMTTTQNAMLTLQCTIVRLAYVCSDIRSGITAIDSIKWPLHARFPWCTKAVQLSWTTSVLSSRDYLSVVKNGDVNNQLYYYNTFKTEGRSLYMKLVANNFYGGVFFCQVSSEEVVQPSEPCDCGWSYRTRIVGGVETGVNEFPSMAALVSINGIHSGAIIVAKRVALTAAHAIVGRSAADLALLVGEHDITKGSETNATRLLRLTALIPHEKFSFDTELYDIGIIITETEIQFSARVGPACLPYNIKRNLVGETVTVTGWGSTDFAGPMSDVLLKTFLRIVEPQRCQNEYTYYSDDQNLCTFAPGKDACQFDSGGPLYLKNPADSRMYVVGIVNRGKSCASNAPAVNARVSYFLEWIDSKVPSANFCVK